MNRILSASTFLMKVFAPVLLLATAQSLCSVRKAQEPAFEAISVAELPSQGPAWSPLEVRHPSLPLHDPTDMAGAGHRILVLDFTGPHKLAGLNLQTGHWEDMTTDFAGMPDWRFTTICGDGPDGFLLPDGRASGRAVRLSFSGPTSMRPELTSVRIPTRLVLDCAGDPARKVVWGTTLSSQSLLLRFKPGEGELRSAGVFGSPAYPEFEGESVSEGLNRGTVVVNPETGQVARAFLYSSRIQIYSSAGSLERSVAGPVDTRLMFETRHDLPEGEERFVMSMQTRFLYLNLAATGDAIFALYSGLRIASPDAAYGREVHVFSWDGRLLARRTLPRRARSLRVAGTPARLWALTMKPNVELEAYPLTIPVDTH